MSLNESQTIMIIFKVKSKDGSYRTISHLERANKSQMAELLGVFTHFLDMKSEDYSDREPEYIIFDYHLVYEGPMKTTLNRYKLRSPIVSAPSFSFNSLKFPITTDITS